MRQLTLLMAVMVLLAGVFSAQAADFYVHQESGKNSFPGSKEQPFKNIQKAIDTAQDGDTIHVAAGNYCGIMDKGQIKLNKQLTILGGYSIHEKQGWENFQSQQTFVSRLRNPSYHYIFRSFAEGTSPENSYAMNPDNYRLMFTGSRQETDFVAVSIRSSGADPPRSLQVQQFEDGLWYVTGYSSTYVEVRQLADQRRAGGHDADLD